MTYRKPREITGRLMDMVEEGLLDRDVLIRAALMWLSEDDVREMAEANDFLEDEPEDEPEPEDETTDEEETDE